MTFTIPNYVNLIINKLEGNGYMAYVVGGSIRDMLLNRVPSDYDIATNALPDDIERIFYDMKRFNIGKKFGTIVISQTEGDVEVTTFRVDGSYIDGRRPEWVSFSSNIIDDLSRRDFTINAIAYNHKTGIVDPYGGREDLKNRIIKTVGNPEERFKEDYLRILRAVRFSTQFDFKIESLTFHAGKRYGANISKASVERIVTEFFKILLCERPSRGIRIMENMEILNIVLPEIIPAIGFDQKNPHHERDVYNHLLCVLDNTPPIIQVRLAALFHDIGKPHTLKIDEKGIGHFYGHEKLGAEISKGILKRFKCSNELMEKVYILIKEHMNHHADFKEKGLKRLIRRVGKDEIFNLMALQKADIKCSNKNASIDHIMEREREIKAILNNKEAYEIKHMDINGKELIDLGFEQGKIIGDILEYLLEMVMENPELNDKDVLKKMALDFRVAKNFKS